MVLGYKLNNGHSHKSGGVCVKKAVEEPGRKKISGKLEANQIIGLWVFFPPLLLSNGASCSANYSFREPEENPTVQKQSLSLIRERNEVLQNVIGYSCCQIARQLPIRTFIDNMWIGTRVPWLLPMDTPLLRLTCLQMYEYTKWPTARGSLLAFAMCG